MHFNEKMRFAVSDNLVLQFYGIILLIATLNSWISISGLVVIPLLWLGALCAVIVYHRQLKIVVLSVEWMGKIWVSLFLPKTSDPVVTNIGKIHWLILCLLSLFGVDALITPIHIQTSSSSLGKLCWVLSLSIAIVTSFGLIKYGRKKVKRIA